MVTHMLTAKNDRLNKGTPMSRVSRGRPHSKQIEPSTQPTKAI